MNEYNKHNVTKEVDLVKLFWAICRNWKTMLLWIVAAAIVAGSAKIGFSILAMRDSEEVTLALSAYKTLVANSLQERNDSRHRMESLSLELQEQQKYVDNSHYMHIDPYNVGTAKSTYFIKTDYEIMPEMIYQNRDFTDLIVNTYIEILTSESNLLTICDRIDMDLQNLKEIISVWSNSYGTFSIQVISNSVGKSENILKLLADCVANNREKIAETIDEHSIGELTYSAYSTMDLEMVEKQQIEKDKLSQLRMDFSEEKDRYETLNKEANQIEEPAYTFGAILKKSIKSSTIGAIFGAFIAFCVIFIRVVISDNVYSADYLAERTNLRVLGALPGDSKKIEKMSKLELTLRRKEGLSTTTDISNGYAVIASYLLGICPEASTVLITGEAEIGYIKNTCEILKNILPEKTFLNGGYILSDPTTIRVAEQCDMIVFVEQAGVSRYTDVLKEVEVIQTLKKTLVGVLVIEN